MRQLLYVSNTARDVPDDLLDDVLASSRRNNLKAGVTGLLLYLEGGFLQVLEGEQDAVTNTFSRISQDKRHWNTNILLDREAPRAFGEWSMGLERPSASAQSEGRFALSRDAIAGRLQPGASADILALLRTFYRVNS